MKPNYIKWNKPMRRKQVAIGSTGHNWLYGSQLALRHAHQPAHPTHNWLYRSHLALINYGLRLALRPAYHTAHPTQSKFAQRARITFIFRWMIYYVFWYWRTCRNIVFAKEQQGMAPGLEKAMHLVWITNRQPSPCRQTMLFGFPIDSFLHVPQLRQRRLLMMLTTCLSTSANASVAFDSLVRSVLKSSTSAPVLSSDTCRLGDLERLRWHVQHKACFFLFGMFCQHPTFVQINWSPWFRRHASL